MSRYTILSESSSGHCCFSASVLDTTRPKKFSDSEQAICEAFSKEDAEAIAKAMNEASPQIEADEPPEMHHHAERPADEIDAGLFSGDAFEDAGARARLRWYMARWEREFRRIEESEKKGTQ